jgi:hypothetical protein
MLTNTHSAAIFILSLLLSACKTQDHQNTHSPASPAAPDPPHNPQDTEELTPAISEADAERIGHFLWRNESGGTRDGLVAWNAGEEFPSLGIGHFIWYPQNYRGPFEESFPALVRFLLQEGVAVPAWLRGPCPWPDRETFLRIKNSPQVEELRTLLADTVGQQARFAAERLRAALPKILKAAHPQSREHIRSRFDAVYAIPHGLYALIDYVNFKGEGVNPTERYQGHGWGLLQVLEAMQPRPADVHPSLIMADFSDAAWKVLQQRIRLSPPERNEQRWAVGWRNRCQTYRQ